MQYPQGIRDLPGQHIAAVPVHNGHQIAESKENADRGDVCTQNLIRMVDDQIPQKVDLGFAPPYNLLQKYNIKLYFRLFIT